MKASIAQSNNDIVFVVGEPEGFAYESALAVFDEVNTFEATVLGVGGFRRQNIQPLLLYDSGGLLKGIVGIGPLGQPFFVYSEDGTFDVTQGGLILDAGAVGIGGTAITLNALAEVGGGNRAVHVNEDGDLFAVDLPAPSWQLPTVPPATDTGTYDSLAGTGAGPWVELTGLAVTCTASETAVPGDRINIYSNVFTVNKTNNRTGTIEFGFGTNGVAPTSGTVKAVSAGFADYIAVSDTSTLVTLVDTDVVSVFARRVTGSQAAFGVDWDGGLGDPHELTVQREA